MQKKLFIFPSSGNGLESFDCLTEDYEFLGFIDDDEAKQKKLIYDYPIYSRQVLEQYPESYLLAVLGSPSSYSVRNKIINGFAISESRFATLIHPLAFVSPRAKIGINSVIMAGTVITSNAVLGSHIIVLPNTVIHHDTYIGDYTIIGSNVVIAGHTHLGNNCYIGSGSNIINGINIGQGVLAGMGSNIIRDIEANKKVAGNPAKELLSKR